MEKIMKKILAVLLAALMASAVMVSCGEKNGNSGSPSSVSSEAQNTISSATSEEVYDAINAAFAEKYPDAGMVIPNAPMEVDETTLNDKFGITTDMVEDYKGEMAGMMTNCDMLLVVKVKEGKMEDVKAALEKAKDDQTAQFEWYAVMGNAERTAAAKVVENGNFAALIMVGIMDIGSDEAPDFTSDVQLAEDTFNKTVDAGK